MIYLVFYNDLRVWHVFGINKTNTAMKSNAASIKKVKQSEEKPIPHQRSDKSIKQEAAGV
jgi:hypothetical protein